MAAALMAVTSNVSPWPLLIRCQKSSLSSFLPLSMAVVISDSCDVKKRFTEEQIIGFLREADAGLAIKELCRRHGFSEASYYLWRSKFGGMSVPDARRLKDLEAENTRLKKLLAEQVFENDLIKDALRKKW